MGIARRLVLASACLSTPVFAKSIPGLLPPGIGLYQLGYRSFYDVTQKFDERGIPVALGEGFSRELSGPEMLSGKQGAELQKLSTVLQEFEGGDSGPGTLTGDLYLGRVRGDVRVTVDTKILGLGFGVLPNLTIFAGIPFVRARVQTNVSLTGENNAQATLDKIGDVAFPELKDGLTEASQLSAEVIKNTFTELGYRPIEEWSYEGVGDLRIGAKTATVRPINKTMNLVSTITGRVDVPTGYVERADTLTDIGFGRGYYSLNLSTENSLNFPSITLGNDLMYAFNMNAKLEKRVPVGLEATIPSERTAKINMNPGDDTEVGFFIGGTWPWVSSRYRVAWGRHFSDSYTGPIEGNYINLSEFSDNWKMSHEISVSYDTARAYAEGKFGFPLIVTAAVSTVIQGRNTADQNYFEISLVSFFSTVSSKKPSTRTVADNL